MKKFKVWLNNIKEKKSRNQGLTKFSTWIVNHKAIVISIFAVLMVLAVVGNFFVKKESDVISYLDNETITKQGLATLEEEFNIIGDFSMGISYLNKDQVSKIVKDIEKKNAETVVNYEGKTMNPINKMVWIGTFDALDSLSGVVPSIKATDVTTIKTNLANKFVLHTQVGEETVDTYVISVYFTIPNSADDTAAFINEMQKIVETRIQEYIDAGTCNAPSVDGAYAFTGSAQNSKSLLESSVGDMPKFVIIAVVAVFFILLFTTRSYLEPLVFLATLGISILLNMGTNIIAGQPMGTVSSITASCATILQLAVAMDYAIFLMHTFYEEQRTTPDPKQAMIQAMPKTIKSVVASSLTTVGGFVALFFMKFGIGYDLGFVLAKGVLLSLITVICLQPVIIILTSKWIIKTQHKWKPLTPRLKFDSKIITKKGVSIPIIVVCIGLLIPAAMFQNKVDLTFISVKEENKNPTVSEIALEASSNQVIVMTPYVIDDNNPQYAFIKQVYRIGYKSATEYTEGTQYYWQQVLDSNRDKVVEIEINSAEEFQTRKAEAKLLNTDVFVRDTEVNPINDIFSVTTLLEDDQFSDLLNTSGIVQRLIYSQLLQSFISNVDSNNPPKVGVDTSIHYLLYTMTIDGEKEDPKSFLTVSAIQSIAAETFNSETYASTPIKMTGNVVAAKELSEVTPKDYTIVNILSVVIIFLILLFTFKSFFLSVILVMVIETGIWINLSLSYFFHQQLHFMAYLIVSAIILGATVDYAILLTSKYKEEKATGATGQAAIRNAIYRSAPSVITSGSIFFVACLAIMLVSTNMIVKQITQLLARNAVFSVVLTFTFLPSILSIKERIYKAIRIKMGKGDPDEGKSNGSVYAVSSKDLEEFKAEHLEAIENTMAEQVEDVVIDAPMQDFAKDDKKD